MSLSAFLIVVSSVLPESPTTVRLAGGAVAALGEPMTTVAQPLSAPARASDTASPTASIARLGRMNRSLRPLLRAESNDGVVPAGDLLHERLRDFWCGQALGTGRRRRRRDRRAARRCARRGVGRRPACSAGQ